MEWSGAGEIIPSGKDGYPPESLIVLVAYLLLLSEFSGPQNTGHIVEELLQ